MRTTSRAKSARCRRRSSDAAATSATASHSADDELHSRCPHDLGAGSGDDAPAATTVSPYDPSADEENGTAAAGLGVSPHEMGGAESDAASVVETPKRGRLRKRAASTTPTRRTPPSKKKQKQPPRARAATLSESPHVSGPVRRWKAISLSWVEEDGEDSVMTGFSCASPVGANPSEQKATRKIVVPGASLLSSPTTASKWPPKGETKTPPRRANPPLIRAAAESDEARETAVGDTGGSFAVTTSGDAQVSPPVDDGGEAVLTPGAVEDGGSEQNGEISATEVTTQAAAATPPRDEAARCDVEAEAPADTGTTAVGGDAIARTEVAAATADVSAGTTDQPPTDTQSVILSPVRDEKKVTPRKAAASKKRRSLDATFASAKTTEFSVDEVAELFAELYQEQEQDDRGMYSITTETVREQTAQCERSDEVEELSLEDFRRLLTYGEVSVESVSSTILPFLDLEEDDVLYDLGCGTGKILLQAVLQTKCAKAVGIELMQNRVQEGLRALNRLDKRELALLDDKSVRLVQGDICKPPASADMSDATVVFINNVMFGPKLMLKVMHQLESIANLKRVVTLRKVCERHRPDKCRRAGNLCANYVDPPRKADIFVSWASKTQVYMYERLDYSIKRLGSDMQTVLSGEALPAAVAGNEQQAAGKKVAPPRKKRGEGKKVATRRTAVRKTPRARTATTKRVGKR